MTTAFLIALVGVFFLSVILLRSRRPLLVLPAVAGDEDMKIVDGSFTPSEADGAEAEAKTYMRQKSAGNVDRARALGGQFALALRERFARLNDPAFTDENTLREHHQAVLFSYAVNRVIADLSPNSILAQTALNVFYKDLEDHTPVLAEHIRDMAAFSLYILCERSEVCVDEEIGKIYARLCGEEGSRQLMDEGNRCYRDYFDQCSRLHEQTQYVKA